ncbi:MAG: methyltransferase domain-containing protein [Proteobacteria bacterium]|nr:methyltransferase domain-containing protein [Pseudomonadota bacterium]
MKKDRDFDDLFDRFQHRIKDTPKGHLRETLIREDLQNFVPGLMTEELTVLDAGCGLGDMSLWLAGLGHSLRAIDISAKMVEKTRNQVAAAGLSQRVEVSQQSMQELLREDRRYDLICIHAVLEWMAEPYEILRLLPRCLKPGGRLSLSIYNRNRSILNSLIKGNFRVALAEDFGSEREHSMTPPRPIDPEQICRGLSELGFSIELQAGLRCFYDLLPAKLKEERSYADILELERRYRQQPPFRDIARYVHFIAHWPA